MKTSTAGIAALAVSVALGLTGCSGDSKAADPKVTTPAGPVATSPPPPAPTTTAAPGQSSTRASEEAAAIAVVQKYVDEYNKALESGSTTALRTTFEKSCAKCLGNATTIDEMFKKRQRIQGLKYTLDSPLVTLHDSRQMFVEGQLSQAGGQVLSDSGAVVHNVTPTPTFRFLWRVKVGASPVIFGSENR